MTAPSRGRRLDDGPPPVPRATYRLQFNRGFRFDDARALVPYLAALGISHVYASPLMMAREGSPHGYDIVDHGRLNPEIGDDREFAALVAELHRHGMGLIVDFVPNHMGVGTDNPWWMDVLEWGRASPYADYFDIDWNPLEPTLAGKVLLPVLGDHYGQVLARGEIELRLDDDEGRFTIRCPAGDFPLAVRDAVALLHEAVRLDPTAGPSLRPVARALEEAVKGRASRSRAPERRARVLAQRARLAEAVRAHPAAAGALAAAVAAVNGRAGQPGSFAALHRLLERQHYRLAYWRVAAQEINYRRFFDINELAGLRMEHPQLFEACHRLVARWLRDGQVQGLRLDHVDGLREPAAYFDRLQRLAATAAQQRNGRVAAAADEGDAGNEAALPVPADPRERVALARAPSAAAVGESSAGASDDASHDAAGDAAADAAGASIDHGAATATEPGRPLYLLVEKILAPHETLREDWAVAGTTGYDFMRDVNGLFVDAGGERALSRAYHRFIGRAPDYEALLLEAKRTVMRQALASELNVLANAFNRLAKCSRQTRDYSLPALREALADVVAHFPVYRSYVTAKGAGAEDRRDIGWAVGRARAGSDNPDLSVFDFVHDVLTLDVLERMPGEFPRRAVVELALRVQQYTGPVMAKAAEDTAFYRYVRLVSLNEVGSEPERFGVSAEAFHEVSRRRQASHPHAMLATATHDHKRGEDLRARLNVLSECPEAWARRVRRWGQLNARKRGTVHGRAAPSRNDEYLFYQVLLGAWPPTLRAGDRDGLETLADRLVRYMEKAAREAKLSTSWLSPDGEYEAALTRFIRRTLNPDLSAPFLDDVAAFMQSVAPAGAVYALAQTLLKLTAPGVPDIYRGCEYWDHSLVDPDNRQDVDFGARIDSLRAAGEAGAAYGAGTGDVQALLRHWRDGRLKQWLIARVLHWRRLHPDVFAAGDYTPLTFTGREAHRLVGFCRHTERHGIAVIVPRGVHGMVAARNLSVAACMAEAFVQLHDARPLPAGVQSVLLGSAVPVDVHRPVAVAELCGPLPVALLGW